MEEARQRPYGLLRLAIEEESLVCLRHASTEASPRCLRRSLRPRRCQRQSPRPRRRPSPELLAHAAWQLRQAFLFPSSHQVPAAWQPTWDQSLQLSHSGTGDVAIHVTALEIAAPGALLDNSPNRLALANSWWRFALGLLAEEPGRAPDRQAEIELGYAAFLRDAGQPLKARKHLREAERLLEEIDPEWNAPLRSRLELFSSKY